MKKILCPTDLSETSHNAISYAAKLAQSAGYSLTLLNVQTLYGVTPVEFVTGKRFSPEAIADRLKNQCAEISVVFKIPCSAIVEPTFRRLSTVISEKSADFDLLVMGSNGADDLYQFFFGSNTYNALGKSPIPVLIVPDGFMYGQIDRVVYAFDYLSERKLPLDPLRTFTEMLGAEVTVLQVMEEAISEVAEQDLRELQFILETKNAGFPLKFETVRSSEIARSINSFIVNNNPDLLALCLQGRNFVENIFHRSVIKSISAICSYPVFVFPEE